MTKPTTPAWLLEPMEEEKPAQIERPTTPAAVPEIITMPSVEEPATVEEPTIVIPELMQEGPEKDRLMRQKYGSDIVRRKNARDRLIKDYEDPAAQAAARRILVGGSDLDEINWDTDDLAKSPEVTRMQDWLSRQKLTFIPGERSWGGVNDPYSESGATDTGRLAEFYGVELHALEDVLNNVGKTPAVVTALARANAPQKMKELVGQALVSNFGPGTLHHLYQHSPEVQGAVIDTLRAEWKTRGWNQDILDHLEADLAQTAQDVYRVLSTESEDVDDQRLKVNVLYIKGHLNKWDYYKWMNFLDHKGKQGSLLDLTPKDSNEQMLLRWKNDMEEKQRIYKETTLTPLKIETAPAETGWKKFLLSAPGTAKIAAHQYVDGEQVVTRDPWGNPVFDEMTGKPITYTIPRVTSGLSAAVRQSELGDMYEIMGSGYFLGGKALAAGAGGMAWDLIDSASDKLLWLGDYTKTMPDANPLTEAHLKKKQIHQESYLAGISEDEVGKILQWVLDQNMAAIASQRADKTYPSPEYLQQLKDDYKIDHETYMQGLTAHQRLVLEANDHVGVWAKNGVPHEIAVQLAEYKVNPLAGRLFGEHLTDHYKNIPDLDPENTGSYGPVWNFFDWSRRLPQDIKLASEWYVDEEFNVAIAMPLNEALGPQGKAILANSSEEGELLVKEIESRSAKGLERVVAEARKTRNLQKAMDKDWEKKGNQIFLQNVTSNVGDIAGGVWHLLHGAWRIADHVLTETGSSWKQVLEIPATVEMLGHGLGDHFANYGRDTPFWSHFKRNPVFVGLDAVAAAGAAVKLIRVASGAKAQEAWNIMSKTVLPEELKALFPKQVSELRRVFRKHWGDFQSSKLTVSDLEVAMDQSWKKFADDVDAQFIKDNQTPNFTATPAGEVTVNNGVRRTFKETAAKLKDARVIRKQLVQALDEVPLKELRAQAVETGNYGPYLKRRREILNQSLEQAKLEYGLPGQPRKPSGPIGPERQLPSKSKTSIEQPERFLREDILSIEPRATTTAQMNAIRAANAKTPVGQTISLPSAELNLAGIKPFPLVFKKQPTLAGKAKLAQAGRAGKRLEKSVLDVEETLKNLNLSVKEERRFLEQVNDINAKIERATAAQVKIEAQLTPEQLTQNAKNSVDAYISEVGLEKMAKVAPGEFHARIATALNGGTPAKNPSKLIDKKTTNGIHKALKEIASGKNQKANRAKISELIEQHSRKRTVLELSKPIQDEAVVNIFKDLISKYDANAAATIKPWMDGTTMYLTLREAMENAAPALSLDEYRLVAQQARKNIPASDQFIPISRGKYANARTFAEYLDMEGVPASVSKRKASIGESIEGAAWDYRYGRGMPSGKEALDMLRNSLNEAGYGNITLLGERVGKTGPTIKSLRKQRKITHVLNNLSITKERYIKHTKGYEEAKAAVAERHDAWRKAKQQQAEMEATVGAIEGSVDLEKIVEFASKGIPKEATEAMQSAYNMAKAAHYLSETAQFLDPIFGPLRAINRVKNMLIGWSAGAKSGSAAKWRYWWQLPKTRSEQWVWNGLVRKWPITTENAMEIMRLTEVFAYGETNNLIDAFKGQLNKIPVEHRPTVWEVGSMQTAEFADNFTVNWDAPHGQRWSFKPGVKRTDELQRALDITNKYDSIYDFVREEVTGLGVKVGALDDTPELRNVWVSERWIPNHVPENMKSVWIELFEEAVGMYSSRKLNKKLSQLENDFKDGKLTAEDYLFQKYEAEIANVSPSPIEVMLNHSDDNITAHWARANKRQALVDEQIRIAESHYNNGTITLEELNSLRYSIRKSSIERAKEGFFGKLGEETDVGKQMMSFEDSIIDAIPDAIMDFKYMEMYMKWQNTPEVMTPFLSVAEHRPSYISPSRWNKMSPKEKKTRIDLHNERLRRERVQLGDVEVGPHVTENYVRERYPGAWHDPVSDSWWTGGKRFKRMVAMGSKKVNPETALRKRGALNGMMQADVAYNMHYSQDLMKWTKTVGGFITRWFKISKTAGSLPTHGTNTIGNTTFLGPMQGLWIANPAEWPTLGKVFKDMVGKKKSNMDKLFVESGGLGPQRGMGRADVIQNVDRQVGLHLDGVMAQLSRTANVGAELVKNLLLMKAAAQSGEFAQWAVKTGRLSRELVEGILKQPLALYNAEDYIFKRWKFYKDASKKMKADKIKNPFIEMTKEQRQRIFAPLVDGALKAFGMYSEIAGIFQWVRTLPLGKAFIGFDAAVGPVVAQWANKYPNRLWSLVALGEYMGLINQARSGIDTDAMAVAGQMMPKNQADKLWLSEIHPSLGRDEGGMVKVNISKYVPLKKYLPTAEEVQDITLGQFPKQYVKRVFQAENPLFTSANYLHNIDPYYGKALVDEGILRPPSSIHDRVLGDRFLSLFGPNIPGIDVGYGYQRVEKAKKGVPRWGHKHAEPVEFAKLYQWTGIDKSTWNIHDFDAGRSWASWELRQLTDFQTKTLPRKIKNGTYSEDEGKKYNDLIEQRKEIISAALENYDKHRPGLSLHLPQSNDAERIRKMGPQAEELDPAWKKSFDKYRNKKTTPGRVPRLLP